MLNKCTIYISLNRLIESSILKTVKKKHLPQWEMELHFPAMRFLIWTPKLPLERFLLQDYWEEVVIELEAAYFLGQCMVEGLSRQLGEKIPFKLVS